MEGRRAPKGVIRYEKIGLLPYVVGPRPYATDRYMRVGAPSALWLRSAASTVIKSQRVQIKARRYKMVKMAGELKAAQRERDATLEKLDASREEGEARHEEDVCTIALLRAWAEMVVGGGARSGGGWFPSGTHVNDILSSPPLVVQTALAVRMKQGPTAAAGPSARSAHPLPAATSPRAAHRQARASRNMTVGSGRRQPAASSSTRAAASRVAPSTAEAMSHSRLTRGVSNHSRRPAAARARWAPASPQAAGPAPERAGGRRLCARHRGAHDDSGGARQRSSL